MEMEVTNLIAKDSSVKMEHSNVNQVIASLPISVAMVTEIAETCQTKLDAQLNTQEEDIVLKQDSNVTTISVSSTLMFAMALMIAEVIKLFTNHKIY